ncbi:hypothetical protein BV20DRAFT_56885 [Pilatotrama ljubarskyi]|nr:hypothetical protein BV20DRAFT_56885 [Pilatotrama ljubarskyi]
MDVASRAAGDSEFARARATIVSCVLALFIESVLYGAFTVAYAVSTWILLYKRSPQGLFSRDIILFMAATLMFSLATTHLSLDVYIAIKSFLATQNGLTSSMDVYETLNDWPTNPVGAAKFAFYVAQTLIGDGFMLYRAYVVWDRMWHIIAIPAVLLAGEVVLGFVTASLGRLHVSDAQARACVDVWCILSVVLNLLCSGLIMKRIIWPANRVRATSSGAKYKSIRRRVLESVIQSAAIYSVASISFGVTSFLSPNIGFPVCHSLFPPVIVSASTYRFGQLCKYAHASTSQGLVFLLIVIRINRNASVGETSSDAVRYLQEVSDRQSHFSVRPVAMLASVYESPRRSSFGSRCHEFVPTGGSDISEKAPKV